MQSIPEAVGTEPIPSQEPTPEGPACTAQFEAFLQGLSERIEVSYFEVRDFVAHGAEVMSFGTFTGTPRGTQRPISADWAMQWRVQGGRLRMTKAFVPSFGVGTAAPRVLA
jgi:ketosteroid isomerase-like protein